MLLLAVHDPLQAISHLEVAADTDPLAQALRDALAEIPADTDLAYYHIVAGQVLASSDEWNLAEYAFRESINKRDDYAEAWAYLGESLQHTGEDDSEEVLSALQKALLLNPDSFSANMFTGLYWRRQGEPEDSLPYFESAAELEPNLPEVYVELGKTLALMGELENAETSFRKAIAQAPQDPRYYRLLAQFCAQYHYQIQEIGLHSARQALLLAEEDPASWDVMGLIMFELGDEYNAERLFSRALELDPSYAPAHLHLGMLYLYLEENTRAFQYLQRAITYANDPGVIEHAQQLLGHSNP